MGGAASVQLSEQQIADIMAQTECESRLSSSLIMIEKKASRD
jgi:hypothetical protein